MKILYNAFFETLDLGKLAPGYLANLIVLTQDPNVISPSDLLELEATATMIAGEWVWQS
jgi:predicted amidohydrolase YtcJ